MQTEEVVIGQELLLAPTKREALFSKFPSHIIRSSPRNPVKSKARLQCQLQKAVESSLTAFFYSIRINDQWRIVFKFENAVAENVRIADINIRLIDYHKTDLRKNCEAILCSSCIQPAMTRTNSDNGSASAQESQSDSWRWLHPTSND